MKKKDIHKKSNSKKAKDGHDFNKQVFLLLKELEKLGLISNVSPEPPYSILPESERQFNPDFSFEKDGEFIIIDNTTTIRNDRAKQKNFDALGVRTSARHKTKNKNQNIRCYIVVPNYDEIGKEKTREKEIKNVKNAKKRVLEKDELVFIDEVLTIGELVEILSKKLEPSPNKERIERSFKWIKEY